MAPRKHHRQDGQADQQLRDDVQEILDKLDNFQRNALDYTCPDGDIELGVLLTESESAKLVWWVQRWSKHTRKGRPHVQQQASLWGDPLLQEFTSVRQQIIMTQ